MDSEFFDQNETRTQMQRQSAQNQALDAQLAFILANVPAQKLRLNNRASVADWAEMPVLRKSELLAMQQQAPPFANLAAAQYADIARVFQSPGPLYEPEGRGANYWRMARALYAAGLRRGQLVYNTFSYHFTPAGAMLESGAAAIGAAVFAAGTGDSAAQVAAIKALKPDFYCGTPSFLKILIDRLSAEQAESALPKNALVSGEALPENLRAYFDEKGINVLQCYATADVGLIAYESRARDGLIVDEEILLEIVRPGSNCCVEDGEVGEVVVTPLNNQHYPLLRFGTGDLSAILPGLSRCGRTAPRLRGWLGRADQSTKIRGLFVHPGQVQRLAAALAKMLGDVGKVRLEIQQVDLSDQTVLRLETEAQSFDQAKFLDLCREHLTIRASLRLEKLGSLPNDGLVISDLR